jgi:hypothetical protein
VTQAQVNARRLDLFVRYFAGRSDDASLDEMADFLRRQNAFAAWPPIGK